MIDEHKEKNKKLYDEKARNLDILVEDKVLLNNETGQKLDSKYTGPCKVKEIGENNNVIITNNKNKKQTVHKDRLKVAT